MNTKMYGIMISGNAAQEYFWHYVTMHHELTIHEKFYSIQIYVSQCYHCIA